MTSVPGAGSPAPSAQEPVPETGMDLAAGPGVQNTGAPLSPNDTITSGAPVMPGALGHMPSNPSLPTLVSPSLPQQGPPLTLAQVTGSAPSATDPIAVRGREIFDNFRALGGQIGTFQGEAQAEHGLPPRNWYIWRSPSMAPYAPIYGMIDDSATRHGLSPEFLQSVVMGEGLEGFIDAQREAGNPYDPHIEIDAYDNLGLDEIGDPAHVQRLIDEAGLDPAVAAQIGTPYVVTNELGESKTTAPVIGYAAAIELIAAELHHRRDAILEYARENGYDVSTFPSRDGYPDFATDFLTYANFNNQVVAREAVRDSARYMRVYRGAPRTDERNVRFNTLLRLATADWYRRAGVYD